MTAAPAAIPRPQPPTTATDGSGSSSGDFGGATVTITGPERDDPSIAAINDTLNAWGETVNLKVEYTGDADWEANINTQVEGGNPPDISFFPQPGKLADFARSGYIVPLTDEVNATLDEFWADGFQLYGNVDDVQYGVPAKTDLKSLVWYQPQAFADAGYEVPTTFDEFTALVDADGRRRWPEAAVRGHRVRPGNRLAVHGLGRGHGASPGRR